MAHANHINHAGGWLEGGLTASFEKLIVDAEMQQMMAETLAPIPVDAGTLALDAIRANITTLGIRDKARVEAGSATQLRAATQPLDLIFADPPYHSGAGEVALDRLLRLGWIGPQTWISLETAFNEDPAINGLALDTMRKVGKAKLSLFRLAPPAA